MIPEGNKEVYNFPHRIDDFTATFSEYRELGVKYNCASFAEGAPGYNPPEFLKEEVIRAINEGHN